LVRWICNSEAYNLTSRVNPKNLKSKQDNPAAGDVAIFTHVYLKSMSAEQLYDSLIVATGAHKSGSGSWEKAEEETGNHAASVFQITLLRSKQWFNEDLLLLSYGSAEHKVIVNYKISRFTLDAETMKPDPNQPSSSL